MKLSQKNLYLPIYALSLLVIGCGDASKDAARLAVAAVENGNGQSAVKLINQAGKNAEHTSAYYYNLGLAKAQSGDVSGAEKAFNNALSIDVTNLDAIEYKAFVLREKGEYVAAHEALDVALGEARDADVKVRVLNSLAVTEHLLGRDDIAVVRLNHAAIAAPGYAPTFFNMAKIFGDSLGCYKEAVIAAEKFEKAANDGGEGTNADDVAGMLKNAIEYKDAMARRVENNGTTGPHRNNAAAAKLIKQGKEALDRQKLGLAEEAFTKAVAADPLSYDASFNLAETYYRSKKYDAAANAYAKAAELAPDILDPVFKQAHLAYAVGNYGKSVTLLTQSIMPRWPEFTEAYKLASYAYCVQKRHYEARVCGEAYIACCNAAGTDVGEFLKWFGTIPQIALQIDR